MPFEEFWGRLTSKLRVEQLIRNWTVDKGYLETGDFPAVWTGGNYIECSPPDAENLQKVPKKDFQFMYKNWHDYLNRKIQRSELKESRYTKYTISILHQYD